MSKRLLAWDATGDFGSLAFMEDDRLVEEVALESSDGFAHVLFGEIESLLARHHLKLQEMDAFATASGPGSFTGVRVGLTAAKGFAEAGGRRVVAVSNLQAIAWFGKKELRAVVIDARRGEIYGAVYDSQLQLVQQEVVTTLADWKARLPEGDVELISNGLAVDGATLAPKAIARAIGSIAMKRLQEGAMQDPADVDANYVRRSDAELKWRE